METDYLPILRYRNRLKYGLTQIAADLVTPRWYAAENTRVGYNKSDFRGKIAKLLNKPLGWPFPISPSSTTITFLKNPND